jgi:DnaJ-domain-containing protein 1
VSVTRKIFDSARSGLNTLLDRVSADGEPLTGIERDELEAELERRVQARAGAVLAPRDNPRARHAGAGEAGIRWRRQQAEARQKTASAGREARRRAEQAAHDQAWRKVQEEARRTGAGAGGARSSSSARSAGGARGGQRGVPGLGRDPKIAKHYKTLDLPYGADFDQVKAAYRKLMRKYHPDLHTQSPQKQKAATELTMQVTQAYNELESYLTRK